MKKYVISTFLFLLATTVLYGQVSLKHTLSQRRHQVVCTDFSPDGRYLVTGGLDSRLFVWDVEKEEVVRELRGLRRFPLTVRYSANGQYIVSGGKDSRVTVWDAHSGEEIMSLRGHRDDVTSIAISPDNRWIASASKDRTIKIWRLADGELLHDLREHRGEVMSVAFNQNGDRLVSGAGDGTVKVWNPSEGSLLRSFDAHDGYVRAVAFSPNGNFIASGGDDYTINIWNARSFERHNSILPHSGWIETLDFSPDGRYLVSGAHDNFLIMIEVSTGRIVFQSEKQSYYVLSVAFNPNGNEFVSSTLFSNDVMVWNTAALNITTSIAYEADETEKVPLAKPRVEWVTPDLTSTSNITARLQYRVFSGYPIEQTVLYLNDQNYTSRDQPDIAFEQWTDEESVVFLREGLNTARLELYYRGGVVVSEELHVEFIPATIAEVPTEPVTPVVDEEEVVELPADTVVPEPDPEPELAEEIAEPEPDPEPETKAWSELFDIPFKNPYNPYRFALIIGNEDYSSYQIGLEKESDVEFAIADAKAFREYAVHVFGVPRDNILFLTNARAIEMYNEIDKIKNIIKALNGKAEIIFYFAGHGFPDEQTREPYLIPVDVTGTNLRFAVKINDLYKELTEYPSERITVFLDACFSGGARNVGLVSARGVRVRPQDHLLQGHLVVFSASSDNQSAHPYRARNHGMFTYFLLNKLRETQGNISYKELSDYITETVGVRSAIINNTQQTPQTNVSPAIRDTWQNWTIR
ncbi:MAG: caspase family protein [Bacteroidales bacterium]|nr:caspase family protein [Bacteroidales bacterium]